MAEFTDTLTDKHIAFIEKQPVYFTATAAADARINLSPKGYADSFRVLSGTQVAYLDLAGSGNETHAHLAADGRITIMFCAFDRSALILRIYGRGRPVLPQDDEWDALAAHFTLLPGTRQIFVIDVESVQTSCGWGVPMMELQHERDTLQKYHRQADRALWVEKTLGRTKSIDGLPTRPTDRFIEGEVRLMPLVELVRIPNGAEAELLRGRIESAGVHAVCFDAGMNIAESVGLMIPVRIMVLDEDLEEARALLAEFEDPGNGLAAGALDR